jgi:hypothetical protein
METITNIINWQLQTRWSPPTHRLEPQAKTAPVPDALPAASLLTSVILPRRRPTPCWKGRPLAATGIFVDDIVALGQGDAKKLHVSDECYFTPWMKSSALLIPVTVPTNMNPPP